MQDAMSAIDLAAAGLPETLKLRLGGHLGPVYELDDPVTDRPNYYGAHVSRAARIEPITPESCVYVAETFAAMLALYNAGQFSCDYVGNTGQALRPAPHVPAPPRRRRQRPGRAGGYRARGG